MQDGSTALLVVLVVAFAAFFADGARVPLHKQIPNAEDLSDLVEWKAFKQQYGKHYDTPQEEAKRFAIFKENLKGLAQRKSSYTSMQAGVTKFYDLTREEFRQKYSRPLGHGRSTTDAKVDLSYQKDFPQTWDWEKKGAVTPVKNELQCGATWAMSAIDVLESVCKIAGYPLIPLSTQQVMDCDTSGSDEGCNGGFPSGAYDYILQAGGVEPDSDYPYKGQFQNCSVNSNKFVPCHMKSFKNVSIEASEQNLMQWIYSQSPVVVCVDIFETAVYDYKGGVISGAECPGSTAQIDHCLALVGWDFINGARVWKLKNQWGTDWGMQGYVYFQIGTNTCGMDSPFSVAPCVKDIC